LTLQFVGIGSDLPAYFSQDFGAVFTSTIDKYVYAMATPCQSGSDILSNDVACRNILKQVGVGDGHDVAIMSDLRGSAALGFYEAASTAVVMCADTSKEPDSVINRSLEVSRIAHYGECAQRSVAYSAMYGGTNLWHSRYPDGYVANDSIRIQQNDMVRFFEHVSLYSVDVPGNSRNSLTKYAYQVRNDQDAFDSQQKISENVRSFVDSFLEKRYDICGECMSSEWELRKAINPNITTTTVDNFIAIARSVGAWGVNVLGYGNRLYLLILSSIHAKAAISTTLNPLMSIPVGFTNDGAFVLVERNKRKSF